MINTRHNGHYSPSQSNNRHQSLVIALFVLSLEFTLNVNFNIAFILHSLIIPSGRHTAD